MTRAKKALNDNRPGDAACGIEPSAEARLLHDLGWDSDADRDLQRHLRARWFGRCPT